MIFMNSEIDKIDLKNLIFQNFQNCNGKNLDLQAKSVLLRKIYLRAKQILQRPIFNFHKKQKFLAVLVVGVSA